MYLPGLYSGSMIQSRSAAGGTGPSDSNIDDDDCDIGDDTCDDSNGEVMKSNALYSQVEAGALDEESFQRAFEVVSQIF